MSFWEIYLMLKLCDLKMVMVALMGLLCILMFGPIAMLNDSHSEEERAKRYVKVFRMFIILVVSVILTVALPTREDLAISFAGSYVTNSKEIKNLPEDSAKLIRKLLEDTSKVMENKLEPAIFKEEK
jgi:Na+/melibiose symporter-like transporter